MGAATSKTDPRLRPRLPAGIPPSSQLLVGAVGRGWIELTDDLAAPRLAAPPATVDARQRLHLPRGGISARFGTDHDVLHVTAGTHRATGSHWVMVVSEANLWTSLAGAEPEDRFPATGWRFPHQDLDALPSRDRRSA